MKQNNENDQTTCIDTTGDPPEENAPDARLADWGINYDKLASKEPLYTDRPPVNTDEPWINGYDAIEAKQPARESRSVPASSARDQLGLRELFAIIQEEASRDRTPSLNQLFLTWLCACNLAGYPFAAGSTRSLAKQLSVSHELVARRMHRLRLRLRMFRAVGRVSL